MKYRWNLPEPLATADVRTDDGTVIVLRRHGDPGGPRLVVSHGNGLATDVYYPFWSLLAQRFDLVCTISATTAAVLEAAFAAITSPPSSRTTGRFFTTSTATSGRNPRSVCSTPCQPRPRSTTIRPAKGSRLSCCSTHRYTRLATNCSKSTGTGRNSRSARGRGGSGSRRASNWPRASSVRPCTSTCCRRAGSHRAHHPAARNRGRGLRAALSERLRGAGT